MIEKDLVFIDLPLDTRERVLDTLVQEVLHLGYIEDKDVFLNGVMEREAIIPTSIGFKVAIPHSRNNTVKKPFIAYVRTQTTFRWDTRNDEDVDTIFLIGVPEITESNLHLKFLSAISRKLMNESFRDELRSANTPEEAFKLLDSINETLGG